MPAAITTPDSTLSSEIATAQTNVQSLQAGGQDVLTAAVCPLSLFFATLRVDGGVTFRTSLLPTWGCRITLRTADEIHYDAVVGLMHRWSCCMYCRVGVRSYRTVFLFFVDSGMIRTIVLNMMLPICAVVTERTNPAPISSDCCVHTP